VKAMIEASCRRMYAGDDQNRFLEVTYQNGDKEILYFRDFASGAMIENIVRRAKQLSIKRQIGGDVPGISTADLLASITQEFREHEDLPNTTNPDDWAKISGKKGERIVFVRTLLAEGHEATGGRQIERRHHRPIFVSARLIAHAERERRRSPGSERLRDGYPGPQ